MQQWDFNSGTAEAPEAAHIVVANNLSATAKDLPSTVAALYNQTLEGGFLILQASPAPRSALQPACVRPSISIADIGSLHLYTSVLGWRHQLLRSACAADCPASSCTVVLAHLMVAASDQDSGRLTNSEHGLLGAGADRPSGSGHLLLVQGRLEAQGRP